MEFMESHQTPKLGPATSTAETVRRPNHLESNPGPDSPASEMFTPVR